jgi:hypothetical protein
LAASPNDCSQSAARVVEQPLSGYKLPLATGRFRAGVMKLIHLLMKILQFIGQPSYRQLCCYAVSAPLDSGNCLRQLQGHDTANAG